MLERFVWAFICVNMSIKVWNRAKALIDDKSAMVPAPGNRSAMMVMPSSGQQPHYVRESKAGGYLVMTIA